MGMLDDLLGAALGGQGLGGGAPQRGGSGLPAGLGGGALAALLPVLLSMLSQGGGRSSGGLGDVLGQVLGGGGLGGQAGGTGGLGGLGGLLEELQRTGHGAHAQSWIGAGQNMPMSPDAIEQVFGKDGLAEFARRAGLSTGEASAGLAQLLPAVVDHVTPQGKLPAANDLESVLGGLMKQFGG